MQKGKPSPENKMVAKYAAAAFGGKPSVREYLHDSEPLTVDMLSCPDRPVKGVTAYSTIGLSDFSMFQSEVEYPARLEIAGACASQSSSFANVIASVAFRVLRTGELVFPGVAMRDYVREYFIDTTVPHLYFTSPFLWGDSLKTLDCGTMKVSWLLAIPISDDELEYLSRQGDDALETAFEKSQIDIYDLRRPSAIF